MNFIYEQEKSSSLKTQKNLKFRKNKKYHFIFLLSSVVLVNFGLGIVLPIFPDVLLKINFGKTLVLGLILGAFAIGQVIFAPIIGYLSDTRYKPKIILQISLIGFFVSNLIIPFYFDNIIVIILIRIFQGISIAGIIPVSLIIVNEISNRKNHSRNYSLIFCAVNFGWMIGSIIGGFLYETTDLLIPFLFSGILSFIGFVLISFLRSNYKKTNENFKNSKIISSKTHKTFKFMPGGIFLYLTLQYVIFIDSWAWSFISPSLAFFSLETVNITVFEFGIYLGFFNLIILVGQAILSRFDGYNKQLMIFIAGILHFIGYGYLVFSTSFIDLLIMATITGVGMSVLYPSVSLYINEISSKERRGFNLSFLTTTTQVAGIIGLIFGGFLGDLISFNWLFLISAFSLLSVSIIILFRYLFVKRFFLT